MPCIPCIVRRRHAKLVGNVTAVELNHEESPGTINHTVLGTFRDDAIPLDQALCGWIVELGGSATAITSTSTLAQMFEAFKAHSEALDALRDEADAGQAEDIGEALTAAAACWDELAGLFEV